MKEKPAVYMPLSGRMKSDNEKLGNAEDLRKDIVNIGQRIEENPYIFRVSVGYASAAAEEISGDTAISCGMPDGNLAIILSDGMGKGIRAAADSRTVVRRLKKDLKSGMQPAKAIKEVNRYMIQHSCSCLNRKEILNISQNCMYGSKNAEIAPEKEVERFATVDLLMIDRNSGKAKFYKMGAATSFLIRDSKVRGFEKAALPVGIIDGIKSRQLSIELKADDIIVMVSDGITEASRSDLFGNWLSKFLHDIFTDGTKAERASDSTGVRKLAKFILNEAIKHYGNRERDDLTVAVVKIRAKNA